MHEVRDEVHVALWSPTATLGTEGLLVGKSDQQQAKIVGKHAERWVKQSSALLEIVAMSADRQPVVYQPLC